MLDSLGLDILLGGSAGGVRLALSCVPGHRDGHTGVAAARRVQEQGTESLRTRSCILVMAKGAREGLGAAAAQNGQRGWGLLHKQ